MGHVEKVLAEVRLPDRDQHNCRVFIDLAESVHIHYREHRLVFDIDEFFEVANAFAEGAEKLKQRLIEGYQLDNGYQTEIIGGKQTETMNIPKPHKSLFNNRMVIEKSSPNVIDGIHIHYRDYRLVMDNKETFDRFCQCVKRAQENLG